MDHSNSADNTEKVSMFQVRKCLRDAGCYDATMSDREMMDFYEALNYSKNTASVEDERRQILEQTDRNCDALEEIRRYSVPVSRDTEKDTSKNDSDFSTSSSDQFENTGKTPEQKRKMPRIPKISDSDEVSSTVVPTKSQYNQNKESVQNKHDDDVIDVFNSIPTTHKPLKRITFKPQYAPPFYCDSNLLNMNYQKRAQKIAEYHLKLWRSYENYQRQSIDFAPWGKPIQCNLRFNGNLLRKIGKVSEEGDVDMQEAAQSMLEDRNSEDDFEIYVSQSGRQTKRKLYAEHGDSDNSNEPKKNKLSLSDSNQATKKPPKKRSLKNEEIIKRSKLFKDVTITRTEKIVSKATEEEQKKKVAEKEAEKFQETLDQLSGDENMENSLDVAELVHSEEPFVRRRIVPPSKKQNGGSTGTKPAGRGRGKRPLSKKGSQEISSSQESNGQKYNPLDTSTTKAKNISKEETGICPLCNLEFPQSDLLQHASDCQDPVETTSTRRYPNRSFNRITCESCDEVLPLDMDYEVHVRECLQDKKRISSKAVYYR